MTKSELIEALKDYPDDMKVCADCGFNTRDPSGHYGIIGVDNRFAKSLNLISLIVSED